MTRDEIIFILENFYSLIYRWPAKTDYVDLQVIGDQVKPSFEELEVFLPKTQEILNQQKEQQRKLEKFSRDYPYPLPTIIVAKGLIDGLGTVSYEKMITMLDYFDNL